MPEKKDLQDSNKDEIEIVIDGTKFKAERKIFKSKREGYGLYGTVKIKKYPYRISMNLIEY